MASYSEYMAEKEKLEHYLNRDYQIRAMNEDLNGMTVELAQTGGESVRLRLLTADARKFAAGALIRQLQDSRRAGM